MRSTHCARPSTPSATPCCSSRSTSCPSSRSPTPTTTTSWSAWAPGCPTGSVIGEVTAVRHEAQDLLVVRRPEGGEALIPFVAALVPTVDLDGGFLVVDPPEGLLDL
ncbi:ribosome maturation factor RimM [Blastococcus sp. TML/M2B]|uniref:ribosome maturation factor RimM n=1 Tax=Blastococcus sp. TML/M2B TaxID=2798727 RepID=UPI0035CCE955